jgi:hypothetical protein
VCPKKNKPEKEEEEKKKKNKKIKKREENCPSAPKMTSPREGAAHLASP